MEKTKDRILSAALELYVRNGYEKSTMRELAATLGITAGALYRHYRSKEDIFQAVLRKMEQFDREYAVKCNLPAENRAENPGEWRGIERADLVRFTVEMFRHWTEDPFCSAFRRMITREQHRSPPMNALFQQYFGRGPLEYVTDLFRVCGAPDPEAEGVRFYGAFFLLMNLYDTAEEPRKLAEQLERILSK